ncbi:MAG TPA: DUF2207 domain-containing protein [Oscillospiraceae bacterium]|nr:DUF2207 domain-containing protein [Oscillospiraceae bacterium]
MKKVSKRILSGTVCLTLLFTMLCLNGCETSYVYGSQAIVDQLNMKAQLTNSGDMNVVETCTVNFKKSDTKYNCLDKKFSYRSGENDITDYSVYDEDNHIEYQKIADINSYIASGRDLKNVCYLNNGDELGLLMPEIDEGERTFTFRYTVKKQVISYKDTSDFYYDFNSMNYPITNMNCTIKLPDRAKKEDLHAWIHCTANSKLSIDSNNQISIHASRVPSRESVEARVCMPTALFSPSTVTSSDNALKDIINVEQEQASKWQAKQNKKFNHDLINIGGGALFLLLGVFLFLWKKRKKVRCKVEVPEYASEVSEGTPAGIANLFYYYDGGAKKTNRGYVFSAICLELSRKGYLKFSDKDDSGLTALLTEKCANDSWTDLSPSETAFFNLISKVAENKTVTIDQFKKYTKNNRELISIYLNDFWKKSIDEIEEKGYFQNKNGITSYTGIFGMLFAIAGVLILLLKTTFVFIPIGVLVGGILMMVGCLGKEPLTEIGEHDYMVWQGLKKFMLELSHMEKEAVPKLELWEKYLVYATMMGISKQVCDQLKLVYPEVADQSYRDTHWENSSYLYYMFDYLVNTPAGIVEADLGTVLYHGISIMNDEVDPFLTPLPSDGGLDDDGDIK